MKREFEQASIGQRLDEWLIDFYGPDGFTTPTRIFRGEINEKHELKLEDIFGLVLKEGDIITIVHCPASPLAIFVGALIVGVAASVLLRPSLPDIESPEYVQPVESPNNRLSGQTNIARPFQRIPDLFGQNRIYPDLIAKTYFEYIANIKYVTEFLCIGRGEYLVEDLKAGETLISDIEGSSAVVYEPDTRPDILLDVTESGQVDGQEVNAPNDGTGVDLSNKTVFWNSSSVFSGFQLTGLGGLQNGDSITIANSSTNDGTYTVEAVEIIFDAELHITETLVEVQETTFDLGVDTGVDITSSEGNPSTIGPFVVPGGTERIWIDIQCPKGLQEIDGTDRNQVTVEFEAHLQRLDGDGDPLGAVQTETFEVSGNTQDPQFETFKFTPDFQGDPYEVSVERLTNTVNDSTIQYFDLTKWTRLAGVDELSDVDVPDFGDVTTVQITTKATEQATSLQKREFNAVVTRKLKTYDIDTQTISVGTSATARMADAAMHLLMDPFGGNKSQSGIDLDGLYTIQESIEGDPIYGDDLGRFCYSFSNSKTSVGDELRTILLAARCTAYRVGDTINFVRDEAKPFPVMLFGKRNKAPDTEVKSVKLFKPGDFDGVQLQWQDQETGTPSTILFPEETGGGSNNKTLNAAGIKNYLQAWNFAKVEYDRLLYQRTAVSTKVTKDGLMAVVHDRVANVDGTNVRAQDGEIVDYSGLEVITSDPIDFEGQASGSVLIRNDDGELSGELAVTPRGDSENGFVFSSSPTYNIFLRGENDYQIGMLYKFVPDVVQSHDDDDYTIQEVSPSSDGYVEIRLIKYDDRIYGADTTVPT